MKTIITTVGTSLLEKLDLMHDVPPELLGKTYHEGKSESMKDKIERFSLTKIEKRYKTKSINQICAETQTILKIKEKHPDCQVYLICTDTILSPLCAKYIQILLAENKIKTIFENSDKHIIRGLIVEGKNANTTFSDDGFPNLIKVIQKIESKSSNNNRPILNISGGYKALIPVVTIMGQLYDLEVNYLYEDSEELIILPKMPVDYDLSLIEDYIPFIDEYYLKIDREKTIEEFPDILKILKEKELIYGERFPYEISFTGQLIKAYAEDKSHYSSKTTLSHIIEYKLFEFFSDTRNHYKSKDNIRFTKPPIRGFPLNTVNGRVGEIDILLQSGPMSAPYICIEVKGIGTVIGEIEKLKEQAIKRQIEPIANIRHGNKPHEFHYIVYQTFGALNERSGILIRKLNQLKLEVEGVIGNGKFRAFLFTIENLTGKEVYKYLLEKKVAPIHLKEVKI